MTVCCQFDVAWSGHENVVAGAVTASSLVVGVVDVGQHGQCRALVPALPPVLHGAHWQSRWRDGRRANAFSLRSLRVWLRLQVGSPTRGRAANLLVRYLAIERSPRPLRGDSGGNLVRSPMGNCPAPAGWD